ncbi:exonuclease SbcCD subunit D [Candidatus Woesearchaeota archaeon]|nr:exonuclease SbcCD subunit D [Candidatus Woesearchaeota archaeon]
MKFMHFSDCHIGGWRDERMGVLGLEAFKQAIEQSISRNVDFVLIAGDLFNSALPPIDKLKEVVIALKRLKQNNIPCYIIPGSHDFSASGKTMLDILEHAELLINVFKGEVVDGKLKLKFTVDKKTNAKITGILGKKGMLDKKYYEDLDRSIENEPGFKIFLFHTAIKELMPDNDKIENFPVSILPKNFDYYGGGHIHVIKSKNFEGYKNVSYPGALFPNNFRELEEFRNGGYYLFEDGKITWNPIIIKEIEVLNFNCDQKTPSQIEKEVLEKLKEVEVRNKIVTIRIKGELISGKASDIQLNDIFGILLHKGAYYVMKSTSLVKSKEFEEVQSNVSSIEEAEEKVIKSNVGQSSIKNEEELIRSLIKVFSLEKQDGETKYEFEKRLLEETDKILKD